MNLEKPNALERNTITSYGKIVLVEPYDEDVELTVDWMNSSGFRDAQPNVPKTATLESEQERISGLHKRPKDVVLHIAEESTKRLLGSIALHDIDLIEKNAVIGIFIGNENDFGQGFGTDAIKAMCKFGFETFELERITLDVKNSLGMAIAAYKKCGFIIDREEDYENNNGEIIPTTYMSVTPAMLTP